MQNLWITYIILIGITFGSVIFFACRLLLKLESRFFLFQEDLTLRQRLFFKNFRDEIHIPEKNRLLNNEGFRMIRIEHLIEIYLISSSKEFSSKPYLVATVDTMQDEPNLRYHSPYLYAFLAFLVLSGVAYGSQTVAVWVLPILIPPILLYIYYQFAQERIWPVLKQFIRN